MAENYTENLEEDPLTEMKVSKDVKTRDSKYESTSKVHPCCGISKSILVWKTKNPVKAVLLIATCGLFVFGIIGFIIMNEMLGRNIPKSFLNKLKTFDNSNQHLTLNANSSVTTALNGHWVEDFDQRDGMNGYLIQMGMAWFKRSYANSVRWEDEFLISIIDDNLTMNGLRGPFAEVYEYKSKLDNVTITKMDIGDFGGITNSFSELTVDSVILYAFKPGSSSEIFFVATLTIDMKEVNTLKVEYRHFDSNVVWKQVFIRQKISSGNKVEDELNDNSEEEYEEEDIWGDYDDWE